MIWTDFILSIVAGLAIVLIFFTFIRVTEISEEVKKFSSGLSTIWKDTINIKNIHTKVNRLSNPGDFESRIFRAIEKIEGEGLSPTLSRILEEIKSDTRKYLHLSNINGKVIITKKGNATIYAVKAHSQGGRS